MDPDATERLAGSLIDGRYRIERVVGAGGFGTVYAARHVGLDAPVAVKVLTLPDGVRPERLVELVGGFLEEARTLKRLRHPNIVSALDVGLLPADARGVKLPYLVMDWCSGPTLAHFLDERAAPMSADEAWRLFEPVLEAMSHAHALRIAHRDLKPANVVLEREREGGPLVPRVIDFGIAKILAPQDTAGSLSTDTRSGASPLTPRYAAPEQVSGARTGPWTDVHALGLIFVEMVIGRPAIDRDNALAAVIDPARPTPRTRGVDVGALEPVLQRALALRPDDRYPDAAALASAMRAAIDSTGRPAAAVPQTPAAGAMVARRTDLAEIDRTAPPSSHTLRTSTGALAPRAATPNLRKRRGVAAASAVALVVAAAVAVGVQHRSHGWPFRMRVREMSGDEVERRTKALHLGDCTSNHAATTTTIGCQGVTVMLMQVVHLDTPESVREHVNNMALAMARGMAGGAKFALDDRTALIVLTAPERLQGTFAAVLGRADADVVTEAAAPPIPKRSEAARQALSAWTGNDLIASVSESGVEPMWPQPLAEPANTTISQSGHSAALFLYRAQGRMMIDAKRASTDKSVMAYARDGDVVLVVAGDPAYSNAEFVRRLLAGARAEEVGVLPTP